MNTKEIRDILPETIKRALFEYSNMDYLQEIRIKVNQPIIVQDRNEEHIISYKVNKEDMKIMMQRISNYSIYAFEEEIRQGFITINGGHRVGLCGKCVVEDNRVKTIKNISSINIRICRQIIGCSDRFMNYLYEKNRMLNTIIISPPKCGKTTILRDIARNVSNGMRSINSTGKKVCIVDERSEISACSEGIPQLDVGIRTDVLDNCMKSEGIMMAIRSMSPDVIICDEIGTSKDMESILSAMSCGVSIITTIHGDDIQDFLQRIVFKELIDNHVFKRAIVLSNRRGAGTLENIYNLEKMASAMEV
ncbi:stage III sporulation protein AA [Clostridium sp. 19966]|uniref:stage III sporulation protein AA n=1 Tax=Clostridium sp. 19966 TaxID=2768166 RepID=UPI0028DDF628|nr:stage III sporulation protein AA [Clostridium sp. 19966]MDT8716589.1 stage III sporulation protein AA [Clostridium sp. 19966]